MSSGPPPPPIYRDPYTFEEAPPSPNLPKDAPYPPRTPPDPPHPLRDSPPGPLRPRWDTPPNFHNSPGTPPRSHIPIEISHSTLYILFPPPPPPLLNPTSTSDPFRTPPTLTLSILLRLRHLGAVGRGVTWRGGGFQGQSVGLWYFEGADGVQGDVGNLGGLGEGREGSGREFKGGWGGLWAPGPPHGSSCGLELVTAEGLKA